MIFHNRCNRSPVPHQSFIWIAEYYDGAYLSEYDFETKKANSFYHIDKQKLIRFGLIGHGSQVFFDVGNGVFTLNDHRLMVSYRTKEHEYPLTGRAFLYNDIITYKDAVSDANLLLAGAKQGRFSDKIVQYNVGYKKNMALLDVNINFQCLLSIPYNEASFLAIKMTSDKDLDGKLIIRRNGLIVDEIHAPLKAQHAGMMYWEIR
ncbi:hypothetical protein [Paenibacillus apiarius]|uniref:hypothetical protein n=1 Tax=Paenibacillus apiarius TaxID=46240 RepID=UPI001980D166|nr:hypothetical protein [Paenibacillus apiarius]MBN3522255.1 hypothetical protein [Paenibacillus apiarius]